MPQFRITITRPNVSVESPMPPSQFFSPTIDGAKAELKKWADKGHHGRYKITETVERVVEEGEC